MEIAMVVKRVQLPSGTTQTLERFWNASATAFFRGPAGATINVKYGKGRFSRNVQKQTLDGVTIKKLTVGAGSLVFARMRMKVPTPSVVEYDVMPGGVARPSPEFDF
ncbi:hypothetical protein [Arthrobacter oryzae]|jgi:hypothetical protein|uniref:hypothetical protein n=1 Tax=Arthrobacter oryzae TaxID=409290 RepID=UPI0027832383|nr:hypothetical protein [Arthrobacter oryzae]MDQ0078277.1 hypothetical protein [Arthrobacter oryzae]